MQIVTAGDSAVFVKFADRLDGDIDPAINDRAIAAARAIRTAALEGVRDVVPSYHSVAVYFDPLRTDYQKLVTTIRDGAGSEANRDTGVGKSHRVPVCYDEDFGPDLGDIAATARISRDAAIALHAARTYRVFMLGFTPGFAYLGIVDQRLAAARLSTPRVHVPAGSVGIAGAQTGIYPSASPGGWRIVGRTPLVPFDLARDEPFLFAAGDSVTFYPIDRDEYERQQAAT